MKQFLVVLLVTVAVFVGWKVLSASSDRPAAPTQRPVVRQPPNKQKGKQRAVTGVATEKITAQTPDGEVEVIRGGAVDGQTSAQTFLERQSTWREYVEDKDIVHVEDAWDLDLGGVDYDADVLCRLRTPSGATVEVTQAEWRRYLALTLGYSLVRSELFAARARAVAKEYGVDYGFTDEQWEAYMDAEARRQAMTRDEYRAVWEKTYGLVGEGALRTRRNSVESIFGVLPAVSDVAELPKLARSLILDPEDQKIVMTLVRGAAEARRDLSDPERLDALANLVTFTQALFQRSHPEFDLRNTWCYLDTEMPEGTVAACVTDAVREDVVQAPWLQPGNVHYVAVEDVAPYLPVPPREFAEDFLREVVWLDVLAAELRATGKLSDPEVLWLQYEEEHQKRSGAVIGMTAHASMIGKYPSLEHYRAFNGRFWSFVDHQPEGWLSDSALREYYDRNRVFIEAWAPSVEVIFFSANRPKGDEFVEDWDGAEKDANDARERIMSGEVEFATLRNRVHEDYRSALRSSGREAAAQFFDKSWQNGVLSGRMGAVTRSFSETEFHMTLNTTSLVQNAVARLGPGEVSPVWRTPFGFVILRVIGVGAADLEGQYEDYRYQTNLEFRRSAFRRWANDVLASTKVLE